MTMCTLRSVCVDRCILGDGIPAVPLQALIQELRSEAGMSLQAHADALREAMRHALAEQGAAMQATIEQALQTFAPALMSLAPGGQATLLLPGRPTTGPPPLDGASLPTAVLQALQAVLNAPAASTSKLPAPIQPAAALNPLPGESEPQSMGGEQALQALLTGPPQNRVTLQATTPTQAPSKCRSPDALQRARLHHHANGRQTVKPREDEGKQGHKPPAQLRAGPGSQPAVSLSQSQQQPPQQRTILGVVQPPHVHHDAALCGPSPPVPAATPREVGGSADGVGSKRAAVITYSRANSKCRAPDPGHNSQPHDAGSAANTKRQRLTEAWPSGTAAACEEMAAVPVRSAALSKVTIRRDAEERMAGRKTNTLQVMGRLSRSRTHVCKPVLGSTAYLTSKLYGAGNAA